MNRRNTIRLLLFVAAVAIGIVMMPRKGGRIYSFEVNRPWGHSLLTAPFDIPIYRDSITIREMRDSLDRTFIPIFQRDAEGGRQLLRQLLAVEGISPAKRIALRAEVEKLYRDGIVSPDEYATLRERKQDEVRFVSGSQLVRQSAALLRSPRVAYAHLDSMFPDPDIKQAMTKMQLHSLLVPNVSLDADATSRLYEERMQTVDAAVGVVQKGERIIDRGDRVTPQQYEILSTYEQMMRTREFASDRGDLYFILGQAIVVVFIFGALYFYLFLFRPRYFDDMKSLTAIMLALISMFVVAEVVSVHLQQGIYLIPFAIVPVMFVVFFDARTALFCHVLEILLCATLSSVAFEFIFLEIIVGMTSIFSLRELTRRSQLMRTAVFVFLVYSGGYVGIELMQTGTLSSMVGRLIGYFGINALLISFAYILIFVFEKIFGLTSMVTLVEMSDINNPVLRTLSEECPGTFQHSMSVSTLASDAARKINANSLIVRAGALYHDIGKTKNPAFFTENQHGVNPHDALDPIRSAKIIIGHVSEGLKIAEKEKLPGVLCDMIAQHHGKGVTRYFMTMFEKLHPGEKVETALFSYPGPNPQTREASLLMMADSVEAASRSLPEHTLESITELVNRIIDGQIASGLHNESNLSFRDIKVIKEAFIQRLRTMYHVRIAYPK